MQRLFIGLTIFLLCAVCGAPAQAVSLTYSTSGELVEPFFPDGADLGLHGAGFLLEAVIDSAASPTGNGHSANPLESFDFTTYAAASSTLTLSGSNVDGAHNPLTSELWLIANRVDLSTSAVLPDMVRFENSFAISGHALIFSLGILLSDGFLSGDPIGLPVYAQTDVLGLDENVQYPGPDPLAYFFTVTEYESHVDEGQQNDPPTIPEPCTVFLFGLAGVSLIGRRKRRKTN